MKMYKKNDQNVRIRTTLVKQNSAWTASQLTLNLMLNQNQQQNIIADHSHTQIKKIT